MRLPISLALLALLVACDSRPRGTPTPVDPVDPPPVPVTLTVVREGNGRVVSLPAGIDCGGDCSESYPAGSTVSLSATADSGWNFAGWSGCTGTGACAPVLSADRRVTARFTALPAPAPEGEWLAGDMHVHTDHSSDGSAPRQLLDQRGPGNVSVADQIGQGERAGLAWMPITDHRTYDHHYDPLWESERLLLIPGEEANGSPHANPIGAVDTVVQGSAYPGRPGWSVLQTSIWDAHSQGAVWSHNHPDDGHVNDDGTPNERANALGADTVEIWNKASGIETELRYAEDRWNAGFRFGGVGASDNHFRELWAIAGPGTPVTLAFAREASERAVLQALAGGRTVISGRNNALSPVLTLEADADGDGVYEAVAGDEVVVAAGTAGMLRLRIQRAIGTTVTVYRNPGKNAGAVFAEFSPLQMEEIRTLPVTAEAAASWYYAEARGPGEPDSVNTADFAALLNPMTVLNARQAITSPVFLGPSLAVPQPAEALPADAGGDDGAQLAIGSAGQHAGFPDLAVVVGDTHVVAEQHTAGATRVLYRRLAADGSSPMAAVDLAPDSRAARFPRIAARGEEVWVVWQDERAGQVPRRPAIYLRHSRDGGSSWLPEQLIRSLAGRAERPAIALTPKGAPVIAWQEIRAGTGFDVFVQVLGRDEQPVNVSGTGKSYSAGNPLDSRSARTPASVWPALAVRGDGRIALAYHDNRSDPDPLWTGQIVTGDSTDVDNWQLRVHTRGDGAWSEGLMLGPDDRADRHAALAFAGDGTLVCVWDQKTLDAAGANLSIRYAWSADGGASFTAGDAAVGADDGAFGQYPRLGTDPDGRVRAVWYDNRSIDWRWRVMTSVFGADRQWSGGQLLGGRGNNTWPAVHGGRIAFASTRGAQRLQRDPTQQIFLRPVP